MNNILATTEGQAKSIVKYFYENGNQFKDGRTHTTRFTNEPLVYFIKNGIIKYKKLDLFKKEYLYFKDTGLIDIYENKSDDLIKVNDQAIVKFVLINNGDLFLFNSIIGHYRISRSENAKYAGFVIVSDFKVKISEKGSDTLGKNPPRKESIDEIELIKMIEDGKFVYYE